MGPWTDYEKMDLPGKKVKRPLSPPLQDPQTKKKHKRATNETAKFVAIFFTECGFFFWSFYVSLCSFIVSLGLFCICFW